MKAAAQLQLQARPDRAEARRRSAHDGRAAAEPRLTARLGPQQRSAYLRGAIETLAAIEAGSRTGRLP
jgi:hypothetical protein